VSPWRGVRCAAKNENTSAVVTSAGPLATTVKKILKSEAIASQVLVRARTPTKAR
jgi:hypothetical protein